MAAELPAYGLDVERRPPRALPSGAPGITRDWAWGGSTGAGVRVALLDSGVEDGHPRVGAVQRAVAVEVGRDGEARVVPDAAGDVSGHGTACASVIRALAPDCELTSVRVLGEGLQGGGAQLVAGLRWALREGHGVVNLSLSTTRRAFAAALRELADEAYFERTVVVASAHNMPVESWPWRFASVVSVASHAVADPLTFFYSDDPPVEFLARGVDVPMGWLGGGTIRATGNSFATPHITGVCALILGRHPGLTAFGVKTILYETATNVGGEAP
ncbi:MAG TPA: S8 family serine peptidase [Solirubrobacteraceae bacterium]|nr:S8 family serine peptidase [Solirubrobacteraceae bacterium]HSD79254.1 S8 family serine peptidase [Solirubrobacteraceae bacterium]